MKEWLKAAAIRAVKTIAQALIACIGTAAVLNEIDWAYAVSAAILAGILSILTSIAGLPEVKEEEEIEELEEQLEKEEGKDDEGKDNE